MGGLYLYRSHKVQRVFLLFGVGCAIIVSKTPLLLLSSATSPRHTRSPPSCPAQSSAMVGVKPEDSSPPLIPETYFDVPTQRLYALSFGLLCQVRAKYLSGSFNVK